MKKSKRKKNYNELRRLSIYIYDAQLKKIDEICRKRNKTRRIVFLEAFQNYISLFEKGEI